MRVYADTNFITRLYLHRPETADAETMLTQARSQGLSHLPITWLLRIEIINAFQQFVYVSRATAQPRVTPEQANAAYAAFSEDLREGQFLQIQEVPLLELVTRVEELALRHSARHGFRTYDLLHVSCALLLGDEIFWSFDERARKLAHLEGLKTNS